jgi:hypothetical protein
VIEAMNLTKRYGAMVAVDDLSFVTERAWHNPRIGSAMDAIAERRASTTWFWPIG